MNLNVFLLKHELRLFDVEVAKGVEVTPLHRVSTDLYLVVVAGIVFIAVIIAVVIIFIVFRIVIRRLPSDANGRNKEQVSR